MWLVIGGLVEAVRLFVQARYAAEYGWDETFEALVARIVADYIDVVFHVFTPEARAYADFQGIPINPVGPLLDWLQAHAETMVRGTDSTLRSR